MAGGLRLSGFSLPIASLFSGDHPVRHLKLFARMNSRQVVESEVERLRRITPSIGPVTILLPAEAANLIGVRPALLSRWRASEQGPAYFKMGGFVRYDLDTVLEFIRMRRLLLDLMH
jgi:hypothetical protein